MSSHTFICCVFGHFHSHPKTAAAAVSGSTAALFSLAHWNQSCRRQWAFQPVCFKACLLWCLAPFHFVSLFVSFCYMHLLLLLHYCHARLCSFPPPPPPPPVVATFNCWNCVIAAEKAIENFETISVLREEVESVESSSLSLRWTTFWPWKIESCLCVVLN